MAIRFNTTSLYSFSKKQTLDPCISLPSRSHFKYRILHAYLHVYCLTKKLVSASAFKGRYEAKLPGPGTDFN